MDHQHKREPVGVAVSFRAPPDLAKRIEDAAAKELISVAAYCRRAASRAIQSEGVAA